MTTIKGINRPVHILMSKKVKRIVVHCPTCPISSIKIKGHQKTACLHIVRDYSAKKDKGESLLKKTNQCEFYQKDSLIKMEYGINMITCTQV